MTAFQFCSIFLLGYCLHQATVCVEGFQAAFTIRQISTPSDHFGYSGEHGRDLHHFSTAASTDVDVVYDETLITKASKKLDWERSEAKSQRPVLNLSIRDASPEEFTTDMEEDEHDISDWSQGQRWSVTVEHLSELGLFANDEDSRALLENCPQLFRLDPSDIQEAAKWTIEEFGLAYLQAAVLRDGNSILLSFRKDDASYGLEFMSLMMMTDAKMACAASSAFLLEAIRGGIQERTVSAALGAASNATSQAGKSIASETMESFRQLRDANRHKK